MVLWLQHQLDVTDDIHVAEKGTLLTCRDLAERFRQHGLVVAQPLDKALEAHDLGPGAASKNEQAAATHMGYLSLYRPVCVLDLQRAYWSACAPRWSNASCFLLRFLP